MGRTHRSGLCCITAAIALCIAVPAFADLPQYDAPLIATSGDQVDPTTCGRWVVWTDRRDAGANANDVYGYDLLTGREFPIATGPTHQRYHDVDSNTVVWQEVDHQAEPPGPRYIWAMHLNPTLSPTAAITTEPMLISATAAGRPAVSGDIIVWPDDRRSRGINGDDIYGYRLSTGEEFPICVGEPSARGRLDIDDDIVVWLDQRLFSPGSYECEVYAHNLGTGETWIVCPWEEGVSRPADWVSPALSGDLVVWQDHRNILPVNEPGCTAHDIYGYDVSTRTEFPVCTDARCDFYPSVSGSRIVWQHDEGRHEVVLRFIEIPTMAAGARMAAALEEPTTIAPDAVDPASPHISGDRVVWDEARNFYTTGRDIYMLVRFSDCSPQHWAFGYVEACAQAGVVAGYGEGAYAPGEPVTRAQMAVYIARALAGSDEAVPSGPPSPSFTDLPADHWAYRHVEYAVAQGVVAGYPEGDYRPALQVDRGQMAVYIARARRWIAMDDDLATAPELFPDVPAGHWAGLAIQACLSNRVVSGYDDGLYRPDWTVTRDQMAVYITRAFQLTL